MNRVFLSRLDEYIAARRYRLVNAVLVCEDDKLVFERYYNQYTPARRGQIKSIWKSILSLTLGIALDRGVIASPDSPVGRYLPAFNGENDPRHRAITIRHLLTMSSGIYWNGGIHYHCPMLDQMRCSHDYVGYIADIPMASPPGQVFRYKEWDVILLSALIGSACGGSAYDFCRENLFDPLGIECARWTHAGGADYPSWGEDATSDLTARDLIKIGRLMLNGGDWDGRRVVSPAYMRESVKPSAANPGYGRLWWLTDLGFHGRGFGGQELNVYPAQNLVTVVQATVTPSSKSYGDIGENIIKE